MEEAFKLSRTNRTASDAKTAEAAELMQKLKIFHQIIRKIEDCIYRPGIHRKTTLSEWLSNESGIPLVSEMARIYLEPIGLDYTAHHVKEVGLLQHFEENQYKNNIHKSFATLTY